MKKTVEVVAALIRDGEKFLICKRPPFKARGDLWEFVGGKVEKGEEKEQALIRECFEELCIKVKPLSVFAKVTHEYDDIKINLTLFNAKILDGEIRLTEHTDMKWITKNEIENYDFCPADEAILEKIYNEN